MTTTFVSAHVEVQANKGAVLVRGIQIGCLKLYESPTNPNVIRIDHIPTGRAVMSLHSSVMLLDIYREVLTLAIILDPVRLSDDDESLKLMATTIGKQCLPHFNEIRRIERACMQRAQEQQRSAAPLMLAAGDGAHVGTRVREQRPRREYISSDEVIIIPASQVVVEPAV